MSVWYQWHNMSLPISSIYSLLCFSWTDDSFAAKQAALCRCSWESPSIHRQTWWANGKNHTSHHMWHDTRYEMVLKGIDSTAKVLPNSSKLGFTSVAETAVEALAARCAASAWRQKRGDQLDEKLFHHLVILRQRSVLRSDIGIILQGLVHLHRRYGLCCIQKEFSHAGSIGSRSFISLFAWSDFKSGKRLITNLS